MKFTFEEIINQKLNEDIVTVKNTIEKGLIRKTKYVKFVEKQFTENASLALFSMIISFFIPFVLITAAEIFQSFFEYPLIFGYLFISFFVFVLCKLTMKDHKEFKQLKKEMPYISDNFYSYNRSIANIYSSVLNKSINELNFNQQKILELVDKYSLFEESSQKINKMLLKEKILNCTDQEFCDNYSMINHYMNKTKDYKEKYELQEIINVHFKHLLEKQTSIKEIVV